MSYSNGLLSSNVGNTGSGLVKGQKGDPGIGFNLDSNGNFDIQNKRLVNVASGVQNNDVIIKSQLDTALTGHHSNSGNIDLQNKYKIINSKDATNQTDLVTKNN